MIDMISDNDLITSGNNSFMASAVTSSVGGKRPFLLLWNPPGSDVIGWCDCVSPAVSPGGPGGYDLRPCETFMGTKMTKSWCKLLGGGEGHLMVLQGNAIANTLPHFTDGRLREYWLDCGSQDRPYQFFTPSIRIPPGNGVMLVGAQDGMQAIASFEWREYLVT